MNSVDPVLQIGDPLVHDVLAAVDVGQDLVDVVLGLEHDAERVNVLKENRQEVAAVPFGMAT